MYNTDIKIGDIGSLDASDIAVKMTDAKLDREGQNPLFFKTGRIIIGKKTYDVVMSSDSSKVSVSRKFGFFGTLFGKNTHTKTAASLETKIAELVKSKEYSILRNNLSRFRQIIRDNPEKKIIEIADYGFKQNRDLIARSGMLHRLNDCLAKEGRMIRFNKIDEYNTRSNIRPSTLMMDSYFQTMDKIASKSLELKPGTGDPDYVQQDQLEKWTSFLARPENLKKINIPLKIHSLLHPENSGTEKAGKNTGWQAAFSKDSKAALRSFIIKNLNYSYRKKATPEIIQKLADKLEQYAELAALRENNPREYEKKKAEFLSRKNWASNEEYQAYKKDHSKFNTVDKMGLYQMFQNVMIYATFRQTSKLGISFFKEQQVPVMFQFADYNGKTLRGEGIKNIVDDNSWKEGKYEENKIGSPITHSELRHARRIHLSEQENGINDNKLIIKLPEGAPGNEEMIPV